MRQAAALPGTAGHVLVALLSKAHEGPWLLPCKVTETFPNFCRRICLAFWVPVIISNVLPGHPPMSGEGEDWQRSHRQEGESSTGHNNPLKGFDKATGQGPERTVCCPLPHLTNCSWRSLASGSFALGVSAICLHGQVLSQARVSVLLGQVLGVGEKRAMDMAKEDKCVAHTGAQERLKLTQSDPGGQGRESAHSPPVAACPRQGQRYRHPFLREVKGLSPPIFPDQALHLSPRTSGVGVCGGSALGI